MGEDGGGKGGETMVAMCNCVCMYAIQIKVVLPARD